MEQWVNNCEGDQKKLFSLIHSLFGSKDYIVARIYQLFYFGIFKRHVFIEKNHMINYLSSSSGSVFTSVFVLLI